MPRKKANPLMKLIKKNAGLSTTSPKASKAYREIGAKARATRRAKKEPREKPTKELLHYLYNYDPGTGLFTWKNPSPTKKHLKGKVAGEDSNSGQKQLWVKGKRYPYTRMVWLYVYGRIPQEGFVIYHINGNRTDNRLVNLREVSHAQLYEIKVNRNPVEKRRRQLQKLRKQEQ